VTRDEIRAAVLDALAGVAPEADPSVLAAGASLREELELDSMDHLNFLIALHDTLGVDIPEQDYPALQSLDDVVEYLTPRLAAVTRPS
jgi:acyl carrier protein